MAKGHDRRAFGEAVDLEARVHAFADALASGTAASFLSPRLRVEVAMLTFTRDDVVSFLAVAPRLRPVVRTVAVKRNVTFCDGEIPGVGGGVAVLSWDQDGLLTHATVQPRTPGAT
jgi:hypothetical protein